MPTSTQIGEWYNVVIARERNERRQRRIKRIERVAAVKISSARRKAAPKFWAPQQSRAQRRGNLSPHRRKNPLQRLPRWAFALLAMTGFVARKAGRCGHRPLRNLSYPLRLSGGAMRSSRPPGCFSVVRHLAPPLGELAAKPTERVLSVTASAVPPLPRGEARGAYADRRCARCNHKRDGSRRLFFVSRIA